MKKNFTFYGLYMNSNYIRYDGIVFMHNAAQKYGMIDQILRYFALSSNSYCILRLLQLCDAHSANTKVCNRFKYVCLR